MRRRRPGHGHGRRAPELKLYVEEHGAGDPLVLIPGLGGTVWTYHRQIDAFAERYRTIVLDLRGSGRSEMPPGPYSMAELADDVADLLDGEAHVVGLSLGGMVAQVFALRHPARVRNLVLVSTAAPSPNFVPLPEETRAAWAAAGELPPEQGVPLSYPYSFAPGWLDAHPDVMEAHLANRLEYPQPLEAWQAQFAASVEFATTGFPVEEIRAPTLIVHGENDRVLPVDNAHALARRIPGARLEVLEGRGHLALIEDPETFNRLVLDFLD